jgi:diacylglycerol kinase family enzyme
MFAVFGNTPQYGGGIRIAPAAQINDGLLEVCIVHKTSRLQLLKTLPLAYSGRHVTSPFVELRHGAQFNVESERPMDVYADGERLTTTPVQFGFMGHKLKMVLP